MQGAFVQALTYSPPVILGRQMLPFSCWHGLLLEAAGSSYLVGGIPTPSDAVYGAWVCSGRFADGIAADKRALEKWPAVDFIDDHDGCLFTAMVHRKPVEELDLVNISPKGSPKAKAASGKRRVSVGKTSGKILEACKKRPSVTIPELAELIGITERSVQRNIQNLQKDGLLQRIGGRKEGHWEVME